MRDHYRMSQNAKGKGKKTKDNDSTNIGDKLNKKFRLSFRGNKSKKEKNKMTKGDDDEDCQADNILGDYNSKDNRIEDYVYLCNNNSNDLDPKIDCQREFTCDNEIVLRRNEQNYAECCADSVQTIREEEFEDDRAVDETLVIVQSILDEIFSAVVLDEMVSNGSDSEIGDSVRKRDETDSACKDKIGYRMSVNNADERKAKISHRRTSISDDNLLNFNTSAMRDSIRRDSLYSVEEYDEDLDENENYNSKTPVQAVNQILVNQLGTTNLSNQKHKKKSFLNLLFGKNKKDKIKPEPSKSKSLLASRKYSSTFELSQKILEKSPSFIRKSIRHVVNKDVPSLLKRSFSVRDTEKKKEKPASRDQLTVMKNLEWARSLQSLVENDNSVSYDDMSFINYDTLNTATYDMPRPSLNLHRTQSLIVHGSPNRNYTRGSSVPTHYQSAIDISEQSEALSLPSLQHAIRENEENVYDTSPPTRYRRRPQSISSEDGKLRSRVNGSFRSAGSGCAKLKRTNACRQKSRDSLPSFLEQRNTQTVRSRSLNHLDTLDMRYGVQCASDATLKDSRSEPDCTRPLLAPPAPSVEPPSPTLEAPISRRHVLSRSQKSSSECFSVNFEVGDESTWDNDLFYPAARGVTLLDALANQSELRSIDLNNCDAWLQDRESNTNTLIGFSQDTANLVGRHIRITAKDYSNKRLTSINSKKFSGSYKPKASSFFSSSTEENNSSTNWPQDTTRLSFQDADSIKKQGKQRWSGFFSNNKDTKMEQLTELLNNYMTYGVPSSQIYPQGQVESLDALYKLEDDWREIINYKELPERQQQQQTALWELIKTEVAYIKTLKVVTDLFLACLKNLQTEGLLKEIDTEKLFSNITEILDTNVLFWRNSLFPMVRDMRKYKQPPCIETMLQGFLNMRDSFRAYFRYCAEQARCQHYCRENNLHNESFAAYLAWCETQKECNRLRLMDILVQPMQRLTKYGLLLKAILKNTDEEVERDSLEHMIKSVDDFVNNVNSSLKQRQDTERLKGLIVRIESYDIVESKDDDLEKLLKTYSPLDLNRPMINCPPERKRHLLLEGDLKLKDSNTSKMEVHCFLLTDILLVCKPSTKKGVATMRVIRQPYLVDRLDVTDLNKETPTLALIYKNEFNMPVAAFILQNNDARKLKSWKEGIAKAQALYAQAKQPTYLEESLDGDYGLGEVLESEFHSLQIAPRSPLASSSRASRVSSLAHSHSGSVEMNDQSSIGSGKDHSRAVSVENENRTASISSDEGVQPLPPDRSPVSQKNSFKIRLFNRTPNTLSVQPYTNLGQSLPNLALGSPNVGTLNLNLNQNTLSVPNTKNGGHLLSPTHRGVSYPPPSPTRGNLRRGLAISQSKNPPLLKTRHVNSSTVGASGQVPSSFDFDVPVIAGVSPTDQCESFSRGQLRQAMVKRGHRNENKRYHTAGVVDDIKRNDNRDANIHKRLSLNYNSQESTQQRPPSPQEET